MTSTEELTPAPPEVARTKSGSLNTLFTAAILISALLLFAVQPMVSKMLLPPYGGAPAVWTTSVLFFQIVLLIGYTYSHFAPRLFGRQQPLVHLALVLIPLLVLPITLPTWAAPDESVSVAGWLLVVLTVMVGLPFVVLSTTGPLVQAWYATLGLPRSRDPYFLYAASNIGSLVALVGYPFVIEPVLGVETQSVWWAVGYGAFVVLVACCAVLAWRRMRAGATIADGAPEEEGAAPADAPTPSATALTWRRRGRWLALAALPSSLMQGSTSYMSTDVAAVPLLWVVPLALYLGTYIIGFGLRKHGWVNGTVDAALILSIPVLLLAVQPDIASVPVAMALSMVMLTVVALASHGLLAKDRPAPVHLTEFFLLVSLGGALGSLFNGVIAPVLFDRVLEYPLALIAVALLALTAGGSSRVVQWAAQRAWARMIPLVLALGATAVVYLLEIRWPMVLIALLFAVTLVLVIRQVVAFTAVFAAFGAALLIGTQILDSETAVLHGRSFFGSYSVNEDNGSRSLSHGTTTHGFQPLDPEKSKDPVSYYAKSGPVGDVFEAYGAESKKVGVVGLGTGVIAAYGQPGQEFDFFEIDPEMVELAQDPERFSYLDDSKGEVRTIVGDGRLRLGETEDGSYDVIILDAFTSDAIPAHMLTREAYEEFADKLAPGGVIAVHVSNRVLELAPMVGATSEAAGLHGLYRSDDNMAADGGPVDPYAFASQWIALAPEEGDLAKLKEPDSPNRGEWTPLPSGGPVWTDSYSSLFRVIK
ncbi:hypothetical protein CLV63_12032 [Murinocardiopsis flavida]|uniref:Spermidine synthase n=1 Tax=Murinocardiopsis flavida TaxID=645275 RepID=A0A2P8D2B6_9ACTN|nr:fused MFS/spermidine synthase [Murinocardiopsis flavida]PSK91306.1 hypothetical protein CLV63_12032 [Murinocardiopsis flavida]